MTLEDIEREFDPPPPGLQRAIDETNEKIRASFDQAHWKARYRKAVDDVNRMNDKGEISPLTNGDKQ